MRRVAVLLLALAACSEPSVEQAPPMDRFLFPVTMAALPATGRSSLLVASSNFDLHYDGRTGGTLLPVDPRPATEGGSAGKDGWALVKVPDAGAGARIGSFAGQVVVASAASCPGFTGAAQPYLAIVPTRYDGRINAIPVAADGSLQPCPAGGCQAVPDPLLHDPWSATLACRADGGRRSVFVGYQATAEKLGYAAGTAWLEEFLVDELAAGPATATGRAIQVGYSTVLDTAYDEVRDRLVVVSRSYGVTAPLFLVDFPPCSDRLDPSPRSGASVDGACAQPRVTYRDVASQLPGADVQAVALSNHQAGLGRRAYVAARLYDPAAAALLGYRPATDLSGALLVMDLEDGVDGRPALTILRVVPLAVGSAQVRVLPIRPALPGGGPRRDLVVVSSSTDGLVTVYDDEEGLVARAIHRDAATGAPQPGREPYGLAVDPALLTSALGPVARVYVASYLQSVVTPLDVPLLAPSQAHFVRRDAGGLGGPFLRIGGIQ